MVMAETILVVEDNPETLELLRRIMERDGYKTILANDGEKGLKYARQNLPDLVILDRLMPKLNGLQLCKKLKEEEDTRHIPVIFLTILDSEMDVIDGLKAGADDYVTKPFSPDELSARVERVLFRSVQTKIEALLDRDETIDSFRRIFDPFMSKIRQVELVLRRNVQDHLKRLTADLHHWQDSLTDSSGPAGRESSGFDRAYAALRTDVPKTNRNFLEKAYRDYGILRWLVALNYRLEREFNPKQYRKSDSAEQLRYMYAEMGYVRGKIERAQRVLRRIELANPRSIQR
jgi:DNA-binding response OmpR family regulator